MSFQCVLFDLDGTLIDSIPLIRESFRYTAKKVLGREIPDEVLLANVGRPLDVQMKLIDPEKADELVRVYREHNHKHHDEWIKPIAGMPELLKTLKEYSVKIGVVTSKSRWLAERGLRVCKIDGYIDALVAADDVTNPKPHPEPILKCLKMLRGSADESVYVGDSPFDIQSGKNAGLKTIAVPFGPFTLERLLEAKPDFVAKTTEELKELILNNFVLGC